MPTPGSSSDPLAKQYYDQGLREYKKHQWVEAARSFDRAIQLGSKERLAHEAKAKALLAEHDRQVRAYKLSGSGPDGQVVYDQAYKAAEKAIQLFGKEQWQPYYTICEVVHRKHLYSAAEGYLAHILTHPAYIGAKDKARECVREKRRQVANDIKYNRQRVAGHAEAGAVERDLQREAAYRRTLNFERLLTPDIFLRIAELGRDADPRLPVRMSGVCQRWRNVLVNQPGVWQCLILGRGRHVALKVRTYIQRSGEDGPGLKELRLTEGFDTNKTDEVVKLLLPHAARLERLVVRLPNPEPFLRHLKGKCERLKVLELTPSHPCTLLPLDLNVMPSCSDHLRELRINRASPDRAAFTLKLPSASLVTDPAVQFRRLRVLRLGCNIADFSSTTLLAILRDTPEIREVHLEGVQMVTPALPAEGTATATQDPLRLVHLTTWSETAISFSHKTCGPAVFDAISAPNLSRLELLNFSPSGTDLASYFRSPAVAEALPGLRSLSLHKTTVQEDLFPILKQAASLEFLDISYCSLTASFFETFISSTKLLPNLIALSLAGNLELRAPVLRDLVNCRLPQSDRMPAPGAIRPPIAAKPRGSMFAPASRRARPSPPSATPSQPSQAPSTTPASTPLARLRWLNVDLCENVDAALYPALERRVPFVSHWLGAPDEDRIRGKGRWDWELDLSVACRSRVGGEQGKCDVRVDGKGGYQVYHTCGQGLNNPDPAKSPGHKSWEWSSQSSQPGTEKRDKKGRAETGEQGGEDRRKRLRAMQEE